MEMLKWWYDCRENFAHDILGTEILWNNRLIKISGKSIYYHNFMKAGTTPGEGDSHTWADGDARRNF